MKTTAQKQSAARQRQARFGHACELKPQIVAGVKVYPSQSWSSYA
jgi:hypothetical protein